MLTNNVEVSKLIADPSLKKESLVDRVRFAITSEIRDASQAAKIAGLGVDTYTLARKLILLKAKRITTPQEEEKIDSALGILSQEKRGSLKKATEITRDILSRYWTYYTHSGEYVDQKLSRGVIKRRKRFENTLRTIREACSNNEELEVPILTREERDEFSALLLNCMGSLCELFNKVRGESR